MQGTSSIGVDLTPDLAIARKVLPKPLLKAVEDIFSKNLGDVALVGGTALAGFFAGHRRSDDLDLFAKDEVAKKVAILSVESLREQGAIVIVQTNSTHYYRSLCEWAGHRFTIDVVLDANLFLVGKFHQVQSIQVAGLETLFKMKVATLVSRCSEKDLYDLLWLFHHFIADESSIGVLVKAGQEIDAGVNVENLLISLAGSSPSEEACDFGIEASRGKIHDELIRFRKQLITMLREFDRTKSDVPLKHAVKMMKRI